MISYIAYIFFQSVSALVFLVGLYLLFTNRYIFQAPSDSEEENWAIRGVKWVVHIWLVGGLAVVCQIAANEIVPSY